MQYREIFRILAYFLLGFSIILLVPLFLAIYYQFVALPTDHPQPHSTFAFLLTIVISLVLAATCFWFGRQAKGYLLRKEGIVSVVFIWLLMPGLAALPFYLSDTLNNPFQAYFEGVSGFTTTGMTTFQAKAFDSKGKEIPIQQSFGDPLEIHYSYYGTISPLRNSAGQIIEDGLEAVSKALLFWRSFIQWIGGGGIVVLFVAVFPLLGFSGKLLYQTEITGPRKETGTPLVAQAALQLWVIYLGLTILQVIALMLTNNEMPWLDAFTISFSSLSTGGFSIHDANIGYYENALTEWVVIIFMVLGAMNFSIYYHAISRKFFRIYNPEFFLYLLVIALSCILAVWYLNGAPKQLLTEETAGIFSFSDSVRYGVFQIVSAVTTTGFATAQYDAWPYAVQALMLILMFVGGMSGSPAGGIKIIRHYMLFRIAQYKVESLFRIGTVRQMKIEDQVIDSSASIVVLCFFLFFIFFGVLGTYVYILENIDPQSAIALSTCMLNNGALGFRITHPELSCAFMSNSTLVISSILMLLGRLEFLVILALLIPGFWRQKG